jgi:hypothetical protein
MIDRRYAPGELRAVITQAEGLIGDNLDDLVRRYQLGASSLTPPRFPHRLIELLLRLRNAAENPEDHLAESAAAVAIAEVGGILEIFEHWRGDPNWLEYQQAVQDPRSYLHAVTTLSVAMALKEHHHATELVPSSTPGPSPDIRMAVTENEDLAVEVKTSAELAQRGRAMSESEAAKFVEDCLDASKRQLVRGQPALLVLGGFHIDQDTFNRIADAAERLMSRGRRRPELLAIVLSHTRFASPTVVHRRVLVGLAHEMRIKSNPRYQGRLRFVGEWSGVWRFEKTS